MLEKTDKQVDSPLDVKTESPTEQKVDVPNIKDADSRPLFKKLR